MPVICNLPFAYNQINIGVKVMFNLAMQFNTSGKLNIKRRKIGLCVSGNLLLDLTKQALRQEGIQQIKQLKACYTHIKFATTVSVILLAISC